MKLSRIQVLWLAISIAIMIPISIGGFCPSCLEAQGVDTSHTCCATKQEAKREVDPCDHDVSGSGSECLNAYLATYIDRAALSIRALPTTSVVADVEVKETPFCLKTSQNFPHASNIHLTKLHFSISSTVLRI